MGDSLDRNKWRQCTSKVANICIVQPHLSAPTETHIRAHAIHLPGNLTVLYGNPVCVDGSPVLSQSLGGRAVRKAFRVLRRRPWTWEFTSSYLKAFSRYRPDIVIAEYGPVGVRVMDACRRASVPLIVYFRGYDASIRDVLATYQQHYPRLFNQASAIVAVSRSIRTKLYSLGAPCDKVHCIPSGVDCEFFTPTRAERSPPVFLSVGKLVEKKAPYLTIMAFAKVRRAFPGARLRMIGEGTLMGVCLHLVKAMQLEDAVTFLAWQPPEVVRAEMQAARCFVQHSIEARNGDSEGTPNSIKEAGASALPVVATRHGGIPELVVEGETGFLVDEGDIKGMASHMLRFAQHADLAARVGSAGRKRMEEHFSLDEAIRRLGSVIESCTARRCP